MRKSAIAVGLAGIASLRLTVVTMVALATGVLLNYLGIAAAGLLVAVSLTVLSINLLAALLVNPRIRRNTPLFLFHVSLLALLCLVLVDDRFSLQARIELSEGQRFDPDEVVMMKTGRWYKNTLDKISFEQGNISVDYGPGLVRGRTWSEILPTPGKLSSQRTIGDATPFKTGGYKIYTTHNKGFAAVLGWQPKAGERLVGTVHFPSYPGFEWKQKNNWQLPGSGQITLSLIVAHRPPENLNWVLNNRFSDIKLSIDHDNVQHLLGPGQSISLADGVLTFEQPRMWMGYRITYNPVLFWLFIVSMLAAIFLGWYFWIKFSVLEIGSTSPAVPRGSYG